MTERPEQVSLSHLMLDSMLDGSIALCDIRTLDMIQSQKTVQGKIPQKRDILKVFRTFWSTPLFLTCHSLCRGMALHTP